MASFSDIVKYQRSQGSGVMGSLATALGQSSLQKIDPRNYLFNRKGMSVSLFPFLKGYQAKTSQTKSGSPALQPTITPAFDKETTTRIKRIDIHTRIGAKNSMVLPMMARDMNIMRQNIQKMTKQSTGSSVRKADMFFKRAPERESAFKSAEKKEGGLLEGLASGAGGLIGGIGNLAGGMLGFLGKTLSLGPFGIIGLVTGGILAYNLIKKINFASIGKAFGGIGDSISYTIKSLFGIEDKEKPLMDIISDKLKDMLGIKDKNKGLLESLIESLTTNLDRLFGTTIFRKLFIEVKYTFNEFLLEAERFFEEASVTFDQMLEEIQRFAAIGLGAIGGAGAAGAAMDLLSFTPYGRGARAAGSIGSKLFNFVRRSRTGRGITTLAGGALGALTADEILEYVKSEEGRADIQNLVDMGKISEAEKNYILEMPELPERIRKAQSDLNITRNNIKRLKDSGYYSPDQMLREQDKEREESNMLSLLQSRQQAITEQAAAGGAQFKPDMSFLEQINEAKRAGRERKYGTRRQDLRTRREAELSAVKPLTPTPVSTSSSAATDMESYLKLIRASESSDNYDSVYSPTGKAIKLEINGKKLSENTIQQVSDWQATKKEKNEHGAGAYAIMDVAGVAREAGLSMTDLFSKENQDKMAISLTRQNMELLRKKGIDPTFENLSVAHGVGHAGMKKLLEAEKMGRTESAADILQLDAAGRKTNKYLVENTASGALRILRSRVSGLTGTPTAPAAPVSSTPKTTPSGLLPFSGDSLENQLLAMASMFAEMTQGMGGHIESLGNKLAQSLQENGNKFAVTVNAADVVNRSSLDLHRPMGVSEA